jgi:hypothetical protein
VFSMIVANAIYCLIMMYQIIKKLQINIWPIIFRFIQNLSIAILSGIMGLLISQVLTRVVLANWLLSTLINILIPTLIITLTYWLLAKWLKFEEANVFLNVILKKFKR